jgi:hypothetical protein
MFPSTLLLVLIMEPNQWAVKNFEEFGHFKDLPMLSTWASKHQTILPLFMGWHMKVNL